MIAGKVKEMKIRSGLTNKQISEISGVPLATVHRVMADQVRNPTFETISAIVTALGGSIDELIGHTPTFTIEETTMEAQLKQIESPDQQNQFQQEQRQFDRMTDESIRVYEMLLAERATVIEGKNKIIEEKDLWIKRLFVISCVLVGIIVAVLVIDLLNPAMGFIRH